MGTYSIACGRNRIIENSARKLHAHDPSVEFSGCGDVVSDPRRMITGGLILADEMGLGKIMQIISLLLLDPPSPSSPALIICPTSLMANWKNEIFRFAPDLSVLLHRGAHRAGLAKQLQSAQIIITTYETAVNDISIFTGFKWSWVICDEAHPRLAQA